MDKDLLYNFYKGKVSIEEGQRVKAWVEASDENEIEKKWVNRTQEIIASTKGDPFEREKQIVNVREEYQQKRFNRTRGDGNNQ